MKNRLSWVCVGLAAMLSMVAGCGLDETYTGLGAGAIPGDPLNPIPVHAIVDISLDIQCAAPPEGDVSEPATPMDVENLEGYTYRFTSLSLSAPLSGMLGDQVNNYFTENIDSDALHVLLNVKTDDRANGEAVFLIGGGKKVDDGYGFDGDASELACSLNGGTFETSEPSFLAFPNSMVKPPALPISELELSGIIAADGSAITKGELVGAMTMADAKAIEIAGLKFDVLLDSLEIPPDLDLDEDGTMDAWLFKGKFEAAKVVKK